MRIVGFDMKTWSELVSMGMGELIVRNIAVMSSKGFG